MADASGCIHVIFSFLCNLLKFALFEQDFVDQRSVFAQLIMKCDNRCESIITASRQLTRTQYNGCRPGWQLLPLSLDFVASIKRSCR